MSRLCSVACVVLLGSGVLVATAVPSSAEVVSPVAQASTAASASGDPVVIDALTDEYSVTSAMPDGTFQSEVGVAPQRAMVNGSWADLDATLERSTDGLLRPRVTTTPLTLSAGGTGPLASMVANGVSMSLTWPTALPTPSIDGAVATYRDVIPDVDLRVFARESGGVAEVLVVKTPAAAQDSRLDSLRLAVHASNATVASDAADNLTVTDAGGQTAFTSPTPFMWDSGDSASAVPESAEVAEGSVPAVSAEVKSVAVDVATAGGRTDVTLTPNQALLDSPDTTFPVFIDPEVVPSSRTQSGWVWTQAAFPDTSWWKTTSNGQPAVGYQGWEDGSRGRNRSYYQFDIGDLGSRHVISAGLLLYETDSGLFSCDAKYNIDVYNSGLISANTDWNHQPNRYSFLDRTAVSGTGSDNSCAAKSFKWDVTGGVAGANSQVTFRVQAPDDNEYGRNYYRRFGATGGKNATLVINYNSVPDVPTGLSIAPAPITGGLCGTSGRWLGSLGSGDYTLKATIDDDDASGATPQSIRAQFAVWDKGVDGSQTDSTNYIPFGDGRGVSLPRTSRGSAEKAIDGDGLKDGHRYGVAARTFDGIDYSPNTASCYFWYDKSAPKQPTIDASASDFRTDGTGTGTVGTQGTFVVSADDSTPAGGGRFSGVDHFAYSFASSSAAADANAPTLAVASRSGSTATASIPFTPGVWGTQYLYVQAVDVAGNRSPMLPYEFYVQDSSTYEVLPGDVTGDGRPDLLAVVGSDLFVVPTTAHSSTHVAPLVQAADRSTAPGGVDWSGTLIAHRGSMSGSGVDDLWALNPASNALRRYPSSGKLVTASTPGYYYASAASNAGIILPVDCSGCAGYTRTWADVTQIVAPGSLNGDDIPDLIVTKSNGTLWFFPGTTASALGRPQQLGSASDWQSWTLFAPGDSSGDNVPDLWAADNRATSAGGTGAMRMFRVSSDANGVVTLAAPVSQPSAFGPAARRLMASPGSTDDDNAPDDGPTDTLPELYTITPANQLCQNELNARSSSVLQFKPHTVIDDGLGSVKWNLITALS